MCISLEKISWYFHFWMKLLSGTFHDQNHETYALNFSAQNTSLLRLITRSTRNIITLIILGHVSKLYHLKLYSTIQCFFRNFIDMQFCNFFIFQQLSSLNFGAIATLTLGLLPFHGVIFRRSLQSFQKLFQHWDVLELRII